MRKIIRLTEEDLTNLVRRTILEQRMDMIASKILNDSELQNKVQRIFSKVDDETKQNIKSDLMDLGVDPNDSFQEVKGIVDNEIMNKNEMTEEEEETEQPKSFKSKLKDSVKGILLGMGFGNLILYNALFAVVYDKVFEMMGNPEFSEKSMDLSFMTSLILILMCASVFGDANSKK